ncbi:uncharacterized protein F5891DRAFT_227908 [Suillus fuscotomentosus]|uniref:Uncharacterized protein n=1 Tax=Suillus fuscotomentosus TaxID=1912939 RepID=A0AAD4E8L4_9AGAM|nr:uncharacterized protein F5891DRAFT_227908 [Suillus fuscotomentosus]KAG1901689.1 hypothetical protein F5891DRAFT_227908 [Suillus fuscotomentosus]
MPILNVSISQSSFNLDTSGVAGFFGGDEAISAMATVHLYRGRRWLGWYNSPGSYIVAKKFGQLANSRFWDGLFPGPNLTPAEVFGLDGKTGPRYWGVLSGTDMACGHLAYLVVQKTEEVEEVVELGGRETIPQTVTILDVGDVILEHTDQAPMMSVHHALLAAIPITINLATCVLCAASGDWLAFALILLGVISGGTSCFVIGSAQLDFLAGVKEPSPGTPPADGILLMRNNVVIVRGAEKDINPITKGKFVLRMHGGPEYRRIGLCSLLLLAQFLLQLLFMPQASTFGQIMFISSVAASWAYNSFLSSLEQEKIQVDLLWKALGNPRLLKFGLKSRAAQAVFACLVLSHGIQRPSVDFKPKKVLHRFISNDTRVWDVWRDKVAEQLENNKAEKSFKLSSDDLRGFGDHERALLASLLRDAEDTYGGYQEQVHKIKDNSHISEKQVTRPDSVV